MTENDSVLEQTCIIWLNFAAKTENEILLEFFQNPIESVAKTENDFVLE